MSVQGESIRTTSYMEYVDVGWVDSYTCLCSSSCLCSCRYSPYGTYGTDYRYWSLVELYPHWP